MRSPSRLACSEPIPSEVSAAGILATVEDEPRFLRSGDAPAPIDPEPEPKPVPEMTPEREAELRKELEAAIAAAGPARCDRCGSNEPRLVIALVKHSEVEVERRYRFMNNEAIVL